VNVTGFGSINCQPSGASARVIVKDNAIFSALTTYQLVINANVQWDQTVALTYGTTLFPGDLSSPVRRFVVTITNNTSFTINAPFYVVPGQRITFTFKNASGGVLSSTITWNAASRSVLGRIRRMGSAAQSSSSTTARTTSNCTGRP
jgi:hypothetical protein